LTVTIRGDGIAVARECRRARTVKQAAHALEETALPQEQGAEDRGRVRGLVHPRVIAVIAPRDFVGDVVTPPHFDRLNPDDLDAPT
jgi:hypothetical protein